MPDNVEMTGIILARSLQPFRSRSGTIGYFPEIVQEIKARYSFLSFPKDDDLVADPPKGVEFRHGKLTMRDQVVVIDKLTVFNDGIAADATSSTDDTDHFLADLIEWAKMALPKAQASGSRYYLSQIEMRMSKPLESYLPAFRPIGEKIAGLLNGYGVAVPRYEATALNLHFDQVGKINPQPGVFYIDRRQGIPFSENLWFSQGPLKTGDHISLLKEWGNANTA